MSKLVFFLGSAGAGKTTLAKAVASRRKAAFFDMDILLRPAADVIMTMHGLDITDRDSVEYKKLCRDLGYRITMDAALDNIGLDTDVFVVGPFTKEASNTGWIESELSRIGRSLLDVEVKVVLVELANEELYHHRIQGRQSALDDWKITHWDKFRTSLGSRNVQWPIPSSNVAYIDNSNPDIEATILLVDHFIYA
ncbi:AAA family ATPase [Paenibacillus wynnii]|uniref:AAA family ATPase n=1 Tax=Paenibacillus wynnii TaxID=268407 RepID=UPI002791B566|nr:AAA family ATPase [Paenibacillus wynnii]MDQ0195311.1 adenylate kinase family enzyme [Paenibacillus wynnii]